MSSAISARTSAGPDARRRSSPCARQPRSPATPPPSARGNSRSTRAGALARISSALPPSVTPSSRFFIGMGSTEVIGSTPDTSTSFSCSTKPRMAFSSPREASASSSLTRIRARCATRFTVARVDGHSLSRKGSRSEPAYSPPPAGSSTGPRHAQTSNASPIFGTITFSASGPISAMNLSAFGSSSGNVAVVRSARSGGS